MAHMQSDQFIVFFFPFTCINRLHNWIYSVKFCVSNHYITLNLRRDHGWLLRGLLTVYSNLYCIQQMAFKYNKQVLNSTFLKLVFLFYLNSLPFFMHLLSNVMTCFDFF